MATMTDGGRWVVSAIGCTPRRVVVLAIPSVVGGAGKVVPLSGGLA